MGRHAALAVTLRGAAERGDLEAIKRTAAALAEWPLTENIPPVRLRDIVAVKRAALSVSGSSDVDTAVRGVAAVAATCGDCHTMLQNSPWRSEHSAARGATVRADMVRHAWAAASLWEGLVQPSEDAWRAGAFAFADDTLTPELLMPGRTPSPSVAQLVAKVRALGLQAESIEDPERRAALYGELTTTCATCHAWLGGGPGAR
jgi:mono/diheme cytochrome c family protein